MSRSPKYHPSNEQKGKNAGQGCFSCSIFFFVVADQNDFQSQYLTVIMNLVYISIYKGMI